MSAHQECGEQEGGVSCAQDQEQVQLLRPRWAPVGAVSAQGFHPDFVFRFIY